MWRLALALAARYVVSVLVQAPVVLPLRPTEDALDRGVGLQ